MDFSEAKERWTANDDWQFADRDAAWNWFFTAGMIAEHELHQANYQKLQRLGARLAELLNEDQWAECEALLLAAGVMPNAAVTGGESEA